MLDILRTRSRLPGTLGWRQKPSISVVAAVVVLSSMVLLAPRRASAHAVLVSSRPAQNGTVPGPNLAILLRYDSRVDPAHSSVSILAPDGKVQTLAIGHQPAPNDLSANVTGMNKGIYMLRWQALSSDGHITRGEFSFHVN